VSLGVSINLERSMEEVVVVSNKPGRLESIEDAIDEVLCKGKMDFKEALSIKGKLAYAEGQLFSRVAAQVCRLLSMWSKSGEDRWSTRARLPELGFFLMGGDLFRSLPEYPFWI
jgi:hypothetical protein